MKYFLLLFLCFFISSCNETEFERSLKNAINKIEEKHEEVRDLQYSLTNDLRNQITSIICSSRRLKIINGKRENLESILSKIFRKTPIVENSSITSEYYSYSGASTISFKFSKDIIENYRSYNIGESVMLKFSGKLDEGLSSDDYNRWLYHRECSSYYNRPKPNSFSAIELETDIFSEEISRSIKRINLYKERLSKLESISSETTVYESILAKRLQEYSVDKNNPYIHSKKENHSFYISKLDKVIDEIRQSTIIEPASLDNESIKLLFK